MSKQADIYIGFFEMGLSKLNSTGKLAYICADRWTKNRYGQALRQHITQHHSLEVYLDMHQVQPFTEPADAYPAITLIGPKTTAPTYYTQCTSLEPHALQALLHSIKHPKPSECLHLTGHNWYFAAGVGQLVAKLQHAQQYGTLEGHCNVGIGVATGADAVFVQHHSLDIEPACKLPLAMPADLNTGQLLWSGSIMVNPYAPDGSLLDLDSVPRTKAYLQQHQAQLLQRYCVKQPQQWYRTIDKPKMALLHTPKLLIPDIKQRLWPVLDTGHCYPHHNLYYITSSSWNLTALQTLLRSNVVQWWMRLHSVPMRNNHYRFQAQYLRHIPLPAWSDVPAALQQQLIDGTDCSQQLYGLTLEDIRLIDSQLKF